MTDISKIMGRLRKLSRLSQSTNENEAATAATAAAMLAKLATEYEIDMESVDCGEGAEERAEPITEEGLYESRAIPGKASTWRGSLCCSIAKSVGARAFYQGAQMIIFGRPSQIQKVRYMFKYIEREVNRLCEEAWEEVKDSHYESGRRFKNSFRLGAAATIGARLCESRKDTLEQKRIAAVNTNDTKALAVVNRIAASDEEVNTAYTKRSAKFGTYRGGRISSMSGYQRGCNAGRSVGLGGARGALGAGTAALRGR